jgi:hypothetical protein
MAKKRLSGLDELMLVNPGLPDRERELGLGEVFLGEDGTLYRLEGLQAEESRGRLAEFYLGEDGTLYQLERFGPFHEPRSGAVEKLRNPGSHYFLGEDGTLYQVIRS